MVLLALILALLTAALGTPLVKRAPQVQPFKIDLSSGLPHLQALIQHTNIPTEAEALYPEAGLEFGMTLDLLRDLKTQWSDDFDWAQQEAELNQVAQFTTTIGDQTLHFVHEKSSAEDAIPLLLIHGWPGSIQEFVPVIKPLTQPWTSPSGKTISFDVVVPSLPGFLFSSAPPKNWTNVQTGALFNTLMTEVLGYPQYTMHATDWGADIGYRMYESFNETVRAALFVWYQFLPPTPQDIADNNIVLNDIEKVTLQRSMDWLTIDQGYFQEQTFKPNDIGLALLDNPIGQLAYLGSIITRWSDPRAGTGPSVLTNSTILTAVSLYYLTGTFQSAVWQYARNAGSFRTNYTQAPTDAPMFFSLFEYNIGFWPKQYVAKLGNLISYKEHDFGGHFAGLDNPAAFIEDIREMGVYYASNELGQVGSTTNQVPMAK
ncbi:Epoxide hydrolase domain protein [Mycena sanguinolenta]|uniref:Epoxide hydrolase domain protein n=1 Tax=Mycena sanguinolenta TaxID=230812 RepID=A0A8H7DAL6_9AGAR|nr:Epoxide hydrolase domain protein [Mycena sanguinolenta]